MKRWGLGERNYGGADGAKVEILQSLGMKLNI